MSRQSTRAIRPDNDASQAWQILVSLVMETRGDWRRKVGEVTGLPFSRIRALRRLADEARTLRELADDMNTDAPAATVAINDLETRGLVERRPHPTNRRAKLVSVTPAGRRMIAAVHKIPDHPPAAFAALPVRDISELKRILKKLSTGD